MTVSHFRVAYTVEDFDRMIGFFRDGLGLEPGELWTDNGRGQMFFAGEASLEIFEPAYASAVDQIEAGGRVSGQIRFAFQVGEINQALERAIQHGATLVKGPVLTPWNDLNARIESPEGLQITLFQVSPDSPPADNKP